MAAKCCICKGIVNPLFWELSDNGNISAKNPRQLKWWVNCIKPVQSHLGTKKWWEHNPRTKKRRKPKYM